MWPYRNLVLGRGTSDCRCVHEPENRLYLGLSSTRRSLPASREQKAMNLVHHRVARLDVQLHTGTVCVPLCRPQRRVGPQKERFANGCRGASDPVPCEPSGEGRPFCALSCELAVVWPRAIAGWWRTRPRLLSTPLRRGPDGRRLATDDHAVVIAVGGTTVWRGSRLRFTPWGWRSPRTSGRSRRAATSPVALPTLPTIAPDIADAVKCLGRGRRRAR